MLKWVQKRALPIPALVLTDPALAVAYRYWSDRKSGGIMPPRGAIDTPVLRLLVPDALWLERDAYAGRLQPLLAARAADGHGTGFAETLRRELDDTFITGMPSLHVLEFTVHGQPLVYQLLLLPTAADGQMVSELLEVCKLAQPRFVRAGPAVA